MPFKKGAIMVQRSVEDLVEEGKIKRFFRTDKNLIVENGIYHVIQRAPGIEQLFVEDSDYLLFIKFLKETLSKFKLRLFSFALLPNHLHLLLQIKERNLSKAMHNLYSRYAAFFNKKYKRKGHVFGGKYRPILCNDEIYLLTLSAYIHLNPFKAGLCKNIQDYRWTSVVPYLQSIKKNTFIDYRYILNMLHRDINKAREEYKDFLYKSSQVPYTTIIDNPDAPDLFLTKVFKFLRGKIRKVNKKGVGKDFSDFEDQFMIVSDRRRLLEPKHKEARMYLIKQLRSRGYDITSIAKILKVSRQTIYNSL